MGGMAELSISRTNDDTCGDLCKYQCGNRQGSLVGLQITAFRGQEIEPLPRSIRLQSQCQYIETLINNCTSGHNMTHRSTSESCTVKSELAFKFQPWMRHVFGIASRGHFFKNDLRDRTSKRCLPVESGTSRHRLKVHAHAVSTFHPFTPVRMPRQARDRQPTPRHANAQPAENTL